MYNETTQFYETIRYYMEIGDNDRLLSHIHNTVEGLLGRGHLELVREFLTVELWRMLPSICLSTMYIAAEPWRDRLERELEALGDTLRRRNHPERIL